MSNWKPLSPARRHHLGLGLAYGMTDVGLVRKANEDNFLIDEELGLAVVADGLGGHQAGDVASADAILTLRHFIKTSSLVANTDHDITIPARVGALLQTRDPALDDTGAYWSEQTMPAFITLFDAIAFANQRLFSHNVDNGNAEGQGMGTTLTGLWQFSRGGPLAAFHVGDSRLYRYRASRLEQLTRDQTLYQQALDAGEAGNLPARNMLLQAVGPSSAVEPAISLHLAEPKDRYLLCTDGLHGMVPPAAIEEILDAANMQNIDQACAALIALTNRYEGRDNVTVVLVCCG